MAMKVVWECNGCDAQTEDDRAAGKWMAVRMFQSEDDEEFFCQACWARMTAALRVTGIKGVK